MIGVVFICIDAHCRDLPLFAGNLSGFLPAHETAQGGTRGPPAPFIIFFIFLRGLLPSEEAALAVDSRSEICWGTEGKKKSVFETGQLFWDTAEL
jgi:hypothetical protein